MRVHRSIALAMAFFCVGAVSAHAEMQNFAATLSAQSEVPPHPDLKGTGDVKATFDTASKMLTYTVTYADLTGKATAAHFHGAAPVGKNAGVMVPVAGPLTSPIKGMATLTDEQAKALEGGELYFNVHTEANKGGEVRGQLAPGM